MDGDKDKEKKMKERERKKIKNIKKMEIYDGNNDDGPSQIHH